MQDLSRVREARLHFILVELSLSIRPDSYKAFDCTDTSSFFSGKVAVPLSAELVVNL